MAIYHIIILPEKSQRQIVNNLKNELYIGGYRYSTKPSSSDAHISLNQISFDDSGLITTIKKEIINIAKKHKPFSLPYSEVTDKIYKDTENKELNQKYPNGWGWVSLLFENKDNELGFLTKELILVAKKLDIDDMDSYVDRIKSLKNEEKQTNDILEYTANHMNICNYALPEKVSEAKSIIEKNIPKEISFDTLALRNLNGENEFEITLHI